ncbi:hypothetical protein TNCV_2061971 [Trichonephila clavipes]|nr:hypothetical protein TNCV_2061971 [Trichonephila clavipes]
MATLFQSNREVKGEGKRQVRKLLNNRSLEFAVTLPLVRSNLWDAQLAVPDDHIGLIGDKSGDQAGQGRVVTEWR